jgi:hypothetical protein
MQCPKPFSVKSKNGLYTDTITVPCGKCPECLSNKAQEWAFRLKEELKASQLGCFITLTLNTAICQIKGQQTHDVDKRTVQLFLKRLREQFPEATIRYYITSEYGPKNLRPHYHGILFGISKANAIEINKAWGLGFVKVGTVTPASINYVCNYLMAKLQPKHNRAAIFALMSRMPGIGKNYLNNEIIHYHRQAMNFTVRNDEGIRQNMPRYYKEKIFDEYEKAKNTVNCLSKSENNYKTDRDRIERLGNDYDLYKAQQSEQYRDRILTQLTKKKL